MSTLNGQEVRFHATADGLVLDASGDITGVVVDITGETASVQLPDGSHIGVPLAALTDTVELRDVAEEPGGGAGGSAADG